MPSYRSLLVFALAASTVTPLLAAEVDIRPFKKNEGRALSHLELVERDKQPLEVPPPRKSTPLAVLAPKSISGKMKALIGVGMVATIAADWALLSHFHHLYDNSNPSDSTPPNSSPNFATPPSNAPAPQQNYVFPQAANSTNTGTNSRREERPRGRRSPADIPSELYPESESRIDAVTDGIVSCWELEARSFSDNVRRTSSHPDLLSRADLEEALDLVSRMLDKLD